MRRERGASGQPFTCEFGHPHVAGNGCPECRSERARRVVRNYTHKKPKRVTATPPYLPTAKYALNKDELAIERQASAERKRKAFEAATDHRRIAEALAMEPSDTENRRVKIATSDCTVCGHEFDQLRVWGKRPGTRCPKCVRGNRRAAA